MSDYKKSYQGLANLIPSMLRNDLNTSLMNNLFDKSLTHEEAINFFGLIGRYFPNSKELRPWLTQPDVDRQVNELIPVMYNKIGTEEHIFTFEDLINKADALGINTSDMANWAQAQSFNFAPPIDLDKFVNFSSYYWVQSALTDQNNVWNTEKLPEYYVIAKPQINDVNKLPVHTATSGDIALNGSTKDAEIWTVTFSSNANFIVSGSISGQIGIGQIQSGIANFTSAYLSFTIKSGNISFANNDFFTINLVQLSSSPAEVTFTGNGNGFLYGAKGNLPFGIISGVQLKAGMRILVKNQTDPVENGIYIVNAGAMTRSYDALVSNLTTNSAKVYVEAGSQQGTWEYQIDKSFLQISNNPNLSEWASNNYWVHLNDLSTFYGLNSGGLVNQAVRPIIEYNNDVELSSVSKSRFNQLPLFNLYYYDSTLANIKSAIFHYTESADAPIDLILQKRVTQDINNDFNFTQSITINDKILYYKQNNNLKTCWVPGPTSPIITEPLLTGFGNGTLTSISVPTNALTEEWFITAIDPTTFSVVGSKTGKILDASIGGYISDHVNFLITEGIDLFKTNDQFNFYVVNVERPRYVELDNNKLPISYIGDPSLDSIKVGAWLTPPQLIHNPELENRTSMIHGDLVDHFRSIINKQIYFSGSTFGSNNYRNGVPNVGLGGNIKVLAKPFNLFAGLLNQKDITPITIIDFAEKQYSIAINSISDFILTSLASVANQNSTITSDSVYSKYKTYYSNKPELLSTYRDTSSPIPNWPLTLPLMGLASGFTPDIIYDPDFNIDVLLHHDGHKTPLFSRDVSLEQSLANVKILRYDNLLVSGVIGFSQPLTPYLGQLWYDNTVDELKVLSIQYEGPLSPATAQIGEFWYDRENDTLYVYNVSGWQITSDFPWIIINLPSLIDQTILKAEKELYAKYLLINVSNSALKWDATQAKYQSADLLSYELGKFAVANNLDPLGSNYISSNAFTWNYGSVTWPFSSDRLARWHKIYEAYFGSQAGMISTSRPDLEPWKLFGLSVKPNNWQYDYFLHLSDVNASLSLGPINTVSLDDINLNSIPTICNGVTLSEGTSILLVGQTLQKQNGFYLVSNGILSRISYSNLISGLNVTVSEGNYKNSIWVITIAPVIIDVDPFKIDQVRKWNSLMWVDLLTAHPDLKISVNPNTDELLPPYVSLTKWESSYSLTNSLPSGASSPYIFGDEGPVEQIWKKSITYNYSQLISSFKLDPLSFLDQTWGFQTYIINGLKFDSFTSQLMTHKNFTLHGEIRSNKGLINGFISLTSTGDIGFKLVASYQIGAVTIFSNSELGISIQTGIVNILTIGSNIVNISVVSQGTPFVIGDTLNISFVNGTDNSTFVPSAQTLYLGLNQLYVNLLRYNSLDINSTFNTNVLKNWSAKLAYRTSSIIENDSLSVKSDILGTVPNTAFDIILKSNPISRNSWLHALRIQVIQIGSDNISPGRDVNGDILYVPTNQGSNWIFRIENYFSRHPQLIKYKVVEDSNYKTFNALTKVHSSDEWRFYETTNGIETVNLPVTITGIQNVIDFIYGYTLKLEEDGWAFGQGDKPDTDPILNRIVGWQLEIEKWIDSLYTGVIPGHGDSLNPFLKGAYFNTPTGLTSSFNKGNFTDIQSQQLAYDLVGDVILSTALNVIREDEVTKIFSEVPLFGCHINVDEIEHLITFNNYISTGSGVIYDPFLGIITEKFLISGKKQDALTWRPSLGGFYLNGNALSKNIAASIDDVADYYDGNKVFENAETSKNALALLGFNKKDYFGLLGINDKTQFNFWKGLVGAKGSNFAISAFLNSVKFQSAKVDEFWAYKIAEYGDARTNNYPELKLQSQDCNLRHTRIYFQEDVLDIPTDAYLTINKADENRWYSLVDLNIDTYFEAETDIKTIIVPESDVNGPIIFPTIVSFPLADMYEIIEAPGSVTDINDQKKLVSAPGSYVIKIYVPAKPKFSPIKLFDYVDKALVEDITTWHPAFNNHTASAFEVINIQAAEDPANYNFSTLTINNPNYDISRAWGDRELGRTWWDTSNLDYIPYYDDIIFPSFEERLARWGSLAEYSNINLYEWSASDIHPSLYDAAAIADQTNADVPSELKKSGIAARKQLYKRTRTWQARPVAWSYVATPPGTEQIEIFNAASTKIHLTSTSLGSSTVVLEHGKFAQYGLTTGMHISGWLDNIPYGELELTSGSGYLLGNSYDLGGDLLAFPGITYFSVIKVVWTNNPNNKGNVTGHVQFSHEISGSIYYLVLSEVGTNQIQKIAITDFAGPIGSIVEYDFSDIGIKVQGITLLDTILAVDVANELSIPTDVQIRAYNNASILIPFPTETLDNTLPIQLPITYSKSITVDGSFNFEKVKFELGAASSIGTYRVDNLITYLPDGITVDTVSLILTKDAIQVGVLPVYDNILIYNFGYLQITATSNNELISIPKLDIALELSSIGTLIIVGYDSATGSISLASSQALVITEYNWKAWSIPSQKDLTGDLAVPYNSWQPVYGNYATIASTRPTIDAIVAYTNSKLVLNTGETVEKYKSVWKDWMLITPEIIQKTSQGATLDFVFSEKVISNRLALYVNGITQLPSSYKINDKVNNIVTTNSINNGYNVVAIHNIYQPTSAELSFDPSIKEDVSIQSQYKNDYQYVSKDVRDSQGNIQSKQYYFWVQNKTTIGLGKTLNIKSAASQLTYGPSTYLTFQEFVANNIPRYKAITIAGLNNLVLKDNTFKLRFTRDFILRDDPNEIDLKNSHTEWSLIRPNQKTKIPETLWNKLVDTVCGQTVTGSLIPSLTRVNYDIRHNTATRFGFNSDQAFVDQNLAIKSLTNTILNTKLISLVNGINIPNTIKGLDYTSSQNWFISPANARNTLNFIWTNALPIQINELFFDVLQDALSENYEFSDIFKTSRLSAHSIVSGTPPITSGNSDAYY